MQCFSMLFILQDNRLQDASQVTFELQNSPKMAPKYSQEPPKTVPRRTVGDPTTFTDNNYKGKPITHLFVREGEYFRRPSGHRGSGSRGGGRWARGGGGDGGGCGGGGTRRRRGRRGARYYRGDFEWGYARRGGFLIIFMV